MHIKRILAAVSLSGVSLTATPRDIQFRSVDFETSVLELHNFGTESVDLTGWRFCSHDENQTRRYSPNNGLNGISIEPGASLFLHVLDDAPAGESNRINFPGNAAVPFDRGPYAFQIYFTPVAFGNGNRIADHLQWAVGGVDNASADERSDEAQSGGVWTNESLWISTAVDTEQLQLTDTTGAVLHGPDDYEAVTTPVVDPSSFVVDTIVVGENGEVTLTWTSNVGVSYEIRRATELTNGADSFGSPIATVTDGSFVDVSPPAGTVFYQVTEVLP